MSLLTLLYSIPSTLYVIYHRIEKVVLRLLTGQCEVFRICNQKNHSVALARAFSVSLRRSKRLSTHSKIIFQAKPKPFSVSSALDFILKTKKIDPMKAPVVVMNMSLSLQALRQVNAVIASFEKKQKTEFQSSDASHVKLLENLWSSLLPDQRRGGESLLSSDDWGLIGFQGKNPTTDFRGMGLLGLQQLEYFARTRPSEARAVLREANHPRRYFPFAATGINMTAFLMELCNNGHYHEFLMRTMDFDLKSQRPATGTTEGEESLSSAATTRGQTALNDEYSRLYIQFCELWVLRDPKDIMAFSSIFAEFKSRVKAEFPRMV